MLRLFIAVLATFLLTGCTYSTLHFFPAVEGEVKLEGKPLKDVQVENFSTYDFSNWTPEHFAKVAKYKTDQDGKFTIPLNTRTGLVGPHVHRIESRIFIYHQDHIYLGLIGIRDYMDNEKIDVSVPLRLTCELSSAPSENRVPGLNGDRYWGKNEHEYRYKGICVYNKENKPGKQPKGVQ